MKVLLTGANGYIGTRLLHILGEAGICVVALVRSRKRLHVPAHFKSNVQIIEGDLLDEKSLSCLPKDIDAAYYLVHSMKTQAKGFSALEIQCAEVFSRAILKTNIKQIIYLSGLSQESAVSEHMGSRRSVEKVLKSSGIPLTTLLSGIIIGSGSASFEIMRDLVEKLPIMIAPKWVSSKSQPIAIRDVLYYLEKVLLHEKCLGERFEIGGPDILTYKEMLLEFAAVRGLKRWIISVPFLTPYLSSLWLFFITSTNFSLARALVDSLKTDSICNEHSIDRIFKRPCSGYRVSIRRAFEKIEQNSVISSWKDAVSSSDLSPHLAEYVKVPDFGCFKKITKSSYQTSKEQVVEKLWRIGGNNGWYYMDWAWNIRGFVDRILGGCGLRRGRTHINRLNSGDVLDFWRVIYANRKHGRLLLYAEMKLPGEAWLEWSIKEEDGITKVEQIATFRPKGIFGRIYWYFLSPIHYFIFQGLCDSLGR